MAIRLPVATFARLKDSGRRAQGHARSIMLTSDCENRQVTMLTGEAPNWFGFSSWPTGVAPPVFYMSNRNSEYYRTGDFLPI